ncbi:unnamed protein product [Porites lobata]|uniref:Transmembrane protein n=1 Tax=Porites lobata TaxID=104759 RepID=A0ABN8NLK8_9CNID|nr:unnamed protein product [Porites lobata]
MADNTNEESRVSNLSTRSRGKACVAVFVIAWMCIVVLSVSLAFMKVSQSTIELVGGGGAFILIFVVIGAAVIACNKRHRPESNSVDVAVSEIPMEDLEKSPVPILPYNHIPHRPVCAEACSTDLPDYFSAISNVPKVSPHLGQRGFWTEDIDNSDNEKDPPPCYEQALRMYGLISIEPADLEDQHQQAKSTYYHARVKFYRNKLNHLTNLSN